ncbi:hypothetical protein DLAC_02066 [Tieghemostelium lacteum]|uniref:Transmembrane protein n=1 Tax=Tieghemostelium lacteum TaxID=361077 RepID=A0A152A462_TIELA|nr:hypothetical protein DLAC_02066 [Tieghemostelium lacteum]|eukprot:KYR00989.1 hypothetical protein DLAC_02066 [Tieghemostelium lacteum]
MKLNSSSLKTIQFCFFIFLLCNICHVKSQYAADVCEFTSVHSGIVVSAESIPQTCWKVLPDVGNAYLAKTIRVQVLVANISSGNTLKILNGDNLAVSPTQEITGTITEPSPQVIIDKGKFVIFLDGESSDSSNFEVGFEAVNPMDDRQLKPSVVVCISVLFGFLIPCIFVVSASCCKGVEKEKMKSRKKVLYYIGSIFGIVLLILVISRKIGI